jgi:hypothetical protein
MIHHVSIPAREPRHVAEVLAELMGGRCHPFGPPEGAFMATSGDEHGTMIEVYPERATLDIPASDDQVVLGENNAPPNTWPFHVLLSVPLERDDIERIGGPRRLARQDVRPRYAGPQAVLPRYRVLARKPADDRSCHAGDGPGVQGFLGERTAFGDERPRVAATDAGHAYRRAGLTSRHLL